MYSREIDGQILTLSASGWTYRNTFVLLDRETGTLWYPISEEGGLIGIAGPLQDRILPPLPATRATWRQWLQQRPDTKYMRYPRPSHR